MWAVAVVTFKCCGGAVGPEMSFFSTLGADLVRVFASVGGVVKAVAFVTLFYWNVLV